MKVSLNVCNSVGRALADLAYNDLKSFAFN